MNLLKCFRFLNSNDFVKLSSDLNQINEFKTFGLMIKDNLTRHLKESNKKYQQFTVFPVNSLKNLKDIKNGSFHQLINNFALFFTNYQVDQSNQTSQSWIESREIKNLVLFCDSNQSLNAFYSLQSERYRYWRNLSGFPSRFHQSKLETQSNDEELTIDYKTDWMNRSLNVEKIIYHKNKNVIKSLLDEDTYDYHLIWCKINLHHATLAYMIDGCLEKGENEVKEMWFHETLAPYQVAINIKMSEKMAVNSRLDEVAVYLMRELSNSKINVFPFFNRFLDLNQLNFERFDKIGIPYVITLNEDNLKKGIVKLRNRDTKLEESMHITRLKVYLFLYLKKWKPQDIVDLQSVNLNN